MKTIQRIKTAILSFFYAENSIVAAFTIAFSTAIFVPYAIIRTIMATKHNEEYRTTQTFTDILFYSIMFFVIAGSICAGILTISLYSNIVINFIGCMFISLGIAPLIYLATGKYTTSFREKQKVIRSL